MRRAILKHRIAAVGAGRLNPMDYVHDLVEQTKFRNVITGTGYRGGYIYIYNFSAHREHPELSIC